MRITSIFADVSGTEHHQFVFNNSTLQTEMYRLYHNRIEKFYLIRVKSQ